MTFRVPKKKIAPIWVERWHCKTDDEKLRMIERHVAKGWDCNYFMVEWLLVRANTKTTLNRLSELLVGDW